MQFSAPDAGRIPWSPLGPASKPSHWGLLIHPKPKYTPFAGNLDPDNSRQPDRPVVAMRAVRRRGVDDAGRRAVPRNRSAQRRPTGRAQVVFELGAIAAGRITRPE